MVEPVSPTHHRSPPLPPPYPQSSSSLNPIVRSPKTSTFPSASTSTLQRQAGPVSMSSGSNSSSSASGSRSSLSNQNPLPSYDSLSSHSRRRSSQTEYTSSSSRSSMSTAPTTPGLAPRQWRPTSHVPPNIAHRHRNRARGSGGLDEEERNRWLSEDEGLDGVSTSIGRRRRRRSSGEEADVPSNNPQPPPSSQSNRSTKDQEQPRPPDDHAAGPGPSTQQRRFEEKQALIASLSSKTDRPAVRRTRSFEPSRPADPPVNVGATDITVGTQPPRIQDIVPDTSSPIQVLGLGIMPSVPAPAPGIEPIQSGMGEVPDFAAGRGGDGIGGISLPIESDGLVDPVLSTKAERRLLLEKLHRILGW